MVAWLSFLLSILFIVLLLAGLVVSKRISFTPGMYFFVIMIINQIYLLFAPVERFIDSISSRGADPVLGMTLGELVILLSMIPKLIQFIAFGILVVGLFQWWKNK